jgi:1,4-alpha-glucan branching enzyme
MNMEGKKKTGTAKTEAKVLTKKVLFELLAPETQEVYLVGDFNNWDTCSNLMKKDKKGIWKTTLSLKPGRYEYRFLVDGNWMNDPACSFCVPNEFGSQNCVRVVE